MIYFVCGLIFGGLIGASLANARNWWINEGDFQNRYDEYYEKNFIWDDDEDDSKQPK